MKLTDVTLVYLTLALSLPLYFFNLLLLLLWLQWVFVAVDELSLVGRAGALLVSVHRLLAALASLAAEHRLEFSSCSPQVP